MIDAWKNKLVRRSLLALSLMGSVALTACDNGAAKFSNTDITGSALVADFELKDLSGEVKTIESYQGQVVAMFFGYTNCPDVCPITLQQMAQVKEMLGEDADKLQVLFVSVDPARDTPELLRQYVPQFHPSFNALVGSIEEKESLFKGLRVYHAKVDSDDPATYLMDHSSSMYVFGKNGNARLLVRHNSGVEPMAQDIRTLIEE